MGVFPQGRHSLLDPFRRRLPHFGTVRFVQFLNDSPDDPLAGETGAFGTIEELAGAEKINSSYVSRILAAANPCAFPKSP
jgi:hypothetical protein